MTKDEAPRQQTSGSTLDMTIGQNVMLCGTSICMQKLVHGFGMVPKYDISTNATTVQSETAVHAYLTSKQLLSFSSAEQTDLLAFSNHTLVSPNKLR